MLILIGIVVFGVIRYKNTARVVEIHGKKKRGKTQIMENLKRGFDIVREETYYLLIQNKDTFIFWVDDGMWGHREFHITANGKYKKSFSLPNGDDVRIVVTRGFICLQQNGSEIEYPVK
jgi:hypothetical protein